MKRPSKTEYTESSQTDSPQDFLRYVHMLEVYATYAESRIRELDPVETTYYVTRNDLGGIITLVQKHGDRVYVLDRYYVTKGWDEILTSIDSSELEPVSEREGEHIEALFRRNAYMR